MAKIRGSLVPNLLGWECHQEPFSSRSQCHPSQQRLTKSHHLKLMKFMSDPLIQQSLVVVLKGEKGSEVLSSYGMKANSKLSLNRWASRSRRAKPFALGPWWGYLIECEQVKSILFRRLKLIIGQKQVGVSQSEITLSRAKSGFTS